MNINKSDMIIYQTEDGQTKIEVTMENETVWLSQVQMVELFQRDKSVISRHINNIFKEGELKRDSTVAKNATVQIEGNRSVQREVEYYNLDVIISVGYRVKSHRGTQFRIWATERLKEYIIKGFTMNDDLLKKAGGGNYFDELLERIRDIRSSEKVFWRKVLDIYATSIDYDPKVESSIIFFKTIQNKMHWAAHGHTAAEIIYNRANSELPYMGMTIFAGDKPRKSDIIIAKNYLKEDEINILNRIVTAYLEFAELQAIRKKPMYMKDWLTKLDDFLKMTDNEILNHAGKISHDEAKEKASLEYEKYKGKMRNELSTVEKHFIESIDCAEKLIKKSTK
ncbi:virulence RhuM family protein [Clostridiaceae bacterium M8S5]|nr:virulence RhuM family protein [Clostridiaceae bacterium M8S5]